MTLKQQTLDEKAGEIAGQEMTFDEIEIGTSGLRPNGTEMQVLGVDEEDRTVMDEQGTWYAFDDCFFEA